MEIRYPQNEAELIDNRKRFLAALRSEENAPRAIQGTIFSRDALVNGKPKCCAMGIAAEMFLGIDNWNEFEKHEGVSGQSVYAMVDSLLGITRVADIETINDSIDPPVFSFALVADALEELWGL